mgnify:CR=1 FL=1
MSIGREVSIDLGCKVKVMMSCNWIGLNVEDCMGLDWMHASNMTENSSS